MPSCIATALGFPPDDDLFLTMAQPLNYTHVAGKQRVGQQVRRPGHP